MNTPALAMRAFRTWLARAITPDTAPSLRLMDSSAPAILIGVPALWCGLRVISEQIARLDVVAKNPSGRAVNLPAVELLNEKPNDYMNGWDLKELMTRHALSYGNFYGLLEFNAHGQPTEIHPQNPNSVRRQRLQGELVYTGPISADAMYKGAVVPNKVILPDRMLHIKGPTDNGLSGHNVYETFAKTFGLDVKMVELLTAYYGNNATPGGVLELDKGAKLNSEQREQAETAWKNAHTAAKFGATVIMPPGLHWKSIAANIDDIDFSSAQQYVVREVARILNISPVKLHDLSDATYSNVSQESTDFIHDTVMPNILRIQAAFNEKLRSPTRRNVRLEFNVSNINNETPLERYRRWSIGLKAGFVNVKMVQHMENLTTLAEEMGFQESGQAEPVGDPAGPSGQSGTGEGDPGNNPPPEAQSNQ